MEHNTKQTSGNARVILTVTMPRAEAERLALVTTSDHDPRDCVLNKPVRHIDSDDLTNEETLGILAELTQAIEGLRTKDTPVEMGKPFTEPFVNKAADDGYAVAKRAIQSVADTHGLVFSPHEVAALVDLGNAFSPMFAAAVAERACLSYKKHGCV